MSTDSTKVVQISGYFQNKRFAKALEHLARAYESNLATEAAILEALVEIGEEGENSTLTERSYCRFLKMRAGCMKVSGRAIQRIMRAMSRGVTYKEPEESSED